MKEVKFTVEFMQPALANGCLEEDECKFPRTSDGKIVFQESWWYSAISATVLNLPDFEHIRPSDIHMDPEVDVETKMYTRKFNGTQERVHECIPAGSKVTFSAMIGPHIPEEDFKAVMDRLGRFVGISPFGHRLGFGKFKLVS